MADLSLYASIKALREVVADAARSLVPRDYPSLLTDLENVWLTTADAEARAKQMHDMAEAATRTACLHDQSADCGDRDCPQHGGTD